MAGWTAGGSPATFRSDVTPPHSPSRSRVARRRDESGCVESGGFVTKA